MRQLILHRQRALACFAMKYNCILNQEPAAFLRQLEQQPALERIGSEDTPTLRNGQTIALPIGVGESRLFVVAYLEKGCLMTQPVTIPAGAEDVGYQVITDYDGARRLTLRLEAIAL